MRASWRTCVFVLLLASVAVTTPGLMPGSASSGTWVCPPCGAGCDDTLFDHDGRCPVCGMSLVPKTAAAAGGAAAPSPPSSEKPLRLAVLLFPGVQIIDYTGPWEVFGQVFVNNHPGFEIYSVAQASGPITTAMGMSVNPRYTFADAPAPDVILLPGGNVPPQLENAAVMSWIRDSARGAKVVFSVCNGAFFLAKAGLLDGLEATTFAALIPQLERDAPKTKVRRDKRFVDNGKIVTAAGLSSGIDGALHVIEKLYGRGFAEVVATNLEYHWQPESGWTRATLADIKLQPVYTWVHRFPERAVLSHEGSADRWETRWKLTTDKPGREIVGDLQALIQEEKWTAETAQGSAAAWRFSDSDGRIWKGTASVEAAPSESKSRVLTVRLARAGAP